MSQRTLATLVGATPGVVKCVFQTSNHAKGKESTGRVPMATHIARQFQRGKSSKLALRHGKVNGNLP